jgi:hypothetical protein
MAFQYFNHVAEYQVAICKECVRYDACGQLFKDDCIVCLGATEVYMILY